MYTYTEFTITGMQFFLFHIIIKWICISVTFLQIFSLSCSWWNKCMYQNSQACSDCLFNRECIIHSQCSTMTWTCTVPYTAQETALWWEGQYSSWRRKTQKQKQKNIHSQPVCHDIPILRWSSHHLIVMNGVSQQNALHLSNTFLKKS